MKNGQRKESGARAGDPAKATRTLTLAAVAQRKSRRNWHRHGTPAASQKRRKRRARDFLPVEKRRWIRQKSRRRCALDQLQRLPVCHGNDCWHRTPLHHLATAGIAAEFLNLSAPTSHRVARRRLFSQSRAVPHAWRSRSPLLQNQRLSLSFESQRPSRSPNQSRRLQRSATIPSPRETRSTISAGATSRLWATSSRAIACPQIPSAWGKGWRFLDSWFIGGFGAC